MGLPVLEQRISFSLWLSVFRWHWKTRENPIAVFRHLNDAPLPILTLECSPMPKSVLVVDDDAIVRQMLCCVITLEPDFAVCGEAENGRDAIEKAQALRPDVILMDLSMPVMDGIEATRALKALMPTVPVIIFSDYSDVFSEKEAQSAGIILVRKSENLALLIERVRALLYPRVA
jgi:CheY-like chemotaxis protein